MGATLTLNDVDFPSREVLIRMAQENEMAQAQRVAQAFEKEWQEAEARRKRQRLERKLRLLRVRIKSERPVFTIPARSVLRKNGACKRGSR